MLSGLYRTPRSGMLSVAQLLKPREVEWCEFMVWIGERKAEWVMVGGLHFVGLRGFSVINRFTRALPFRLHLISSPHFTLCAQWPLGIVASSWYTVTNGEVSEITPTHCHLGLRPNFFNHFKNFLKSFKITFRYFSHWVAFHFSPPHRIT